MAGRVTQWLTNYPWWLSLHHYHDENIDDHSLRRNRKQMNRWNETWLTRICEQQSGVIQRNHRAGRDEGMLLLLEEVEESRPHARRGPFRRLISPWGVRKSSYHVKHACNVCRHKGEQQLFLRHVIKVMMRQFTCPGHCFSDLGDTVELQAGGFNPDVPKIRDQINITGMGCINETRKKAYPILLTSSITPQSHYYSLTSMYSLVTHH